MAQFPPQTFRATATWHASTSAALARWLGLAAVCIALAACGGGSGPVETAAAQAPQVDGSIECARLGYACTWAQVDRELIERSDELAEALRVRIDGGMSTADAVAWLRTQVTLAEVQFDDAKVRFRLPGSRAVWAAKAGSLSIASAGGSTGPAGAQALLTRARASQASPTAMPSARDMKPQRVIRPGAKARSALVLAPNAWQNQYMRLDDVAEILNAMPDYGSHVTLRQNMAPDDEQVTVHDFRGWEEHDVVMVLAHGGEICWNAGTGEPYHACKGAIWAQRSTNPIVDAIEDDNVGVELARYEGYASLIVTEDFFRHEYPQGLNDKLVYMLACSSWNAGLVSALQGATGVYVGWQGNVVSADGQYLATQMFELLAAGLDIKEILPMMGDQLVSPSTGATLQATDRWLRIRDLIAVQDAYTGLKVTDDSGIEVGMRPGDGQADHVLLEITLDGIRPENADAYTLDVVLDGVGRRSIPVGLRAQHLGNYRWKLPLELPLEFDAQPGQMLALQFTLHLPGQGYSIEQASPKVNDAATLPLEWSMTSTTVQTGPVATVVKTAHLEWELEPGTLPDARYRYYRVKGGTLVYEYSGDINNCKVQFTETVEIPPGATNHSLKFDMGANPALFSGFARASTKAVNVEGSCSDGSTLPYSTTVGGVYLYADDLAVNGNTSFSGNWNDGAGTQISFQFTKRR